MSHALGGVVSTVALTEQLPNNSNAKAKVLVALSARVFTVGCSMLTALMPSQTVVMLAD